MAYCTNCGKDTPPGDLLVDRSTGEPRFACSVKCIKEMQDDDYAMKMAMEAADEVDEADLAQDTAVPSEELAKEELEEAPAEPVKPQRRKPGPKPGSRRKPRAAK